MNLTRKKILIATTICALAIGSWYFLTFRTFKHIQVCFRRNGYSVFDIMVISLIIYFALNQKLSWQNPRHIFHRPQWGPLSYISSVTVQHLPHGEVRLSLKIGMILWALVLLSSSHSLLKISSNSMLTIYLLVD